MRRIVLVVQITAVILVSGQASFGQGFQGGLRGAVQDAGGGVPGAAVTLTNENTNLARADGHQRRRGNTPLPPSSPASTA